MKTPTYKLSFFFLFIITQIVYMQSLISNTPSELEMDIGDTFEIYIKAENIQDIFGLSFNYNYNKEFIKFLSVEDELFFGNDVVFFPNNNPDNGIMSIGVSRKAGQTDTSGSGNIVKAIFEITNLPNQITSIAFFISDIFANNSIGNTVTLSSDTSYTQIGIPSSVYTNSEIGQYKFSLSQNYPNPFNPTTSIKYNIPLDEKRKTKIVKLIVFDILGNEVATLVNEEKQSGYYEVNFNASKISSGIYLYSIIAGKFVETKKMIFLK